MARPQPQPVGWALGQRLVTPQLLALLVAFAKWVRDTLDTFAGVGDSSYRKFGHMVVSLFAGVPCCRVGHFAANDANGVGLVGKTLSKFKFQTIISKNIQTGNTFELGLMIVNMETKSSSFNDKKFFNMSFNLELFLKHIKQRILRKITERSNAYLCKISCGDQFKDEIAPLPHYYYRFSTKKSKNNSVFEEDYSKPLELYNFSPKYSQIDVLFKPSPLYKKDATISGVFSTRLLSIRYSIPFFESMLNFFLLKEICRSFR